VSTPLLNGQARSEPGAAPALQRLAPAPGGRARLRETRPLSRICAASPAWRVVGVGAFTRFIAGTGGPLTFRAQPP
jgi:hypothetical protein